MKLFNRKKTKRSVQYFDTSGFNSWIVSGGYTTLDKNADVQICVNKIADIVSSMPVALMQNVENGDIQIKNGLSRIVDINPNKHQTRKTFIQTIVREAFLKGDGNAIVLPKFNNSNGSYFLDSLDVLDMNKVTFNTNDNTYNINYQGKVLYPDEVLHFVFNPSRQSSFIGEGYAPLLKDVLSNIAQGNATKQSFFKQPKPSLIIGVNSDNGELMDGDGQKVIRESYTSNMENGKPWLIPADEISVHQIQPLSLKDLAINESLEVERKQIAAAFGIPSFLVGIGKFDKTEYNNFINTTIQSIADVIQQEFTKKLLYSELMYFKFKKKALMQYDIGELSTFANESVKLGILNRNESRNLFDYSPVDKESMNEYSTLENYINIDDMSKQKKLVQDEPSEEGGENT
ncbi:phage portal protein [Lysinibacillus sp. FSL K6-4013]|uniref:phage portal protein n=1 Tax=Lysinibacillus sp. FSL K6-4013 TaxID=2921504 RepID=UPI003159E7BB